MATRNEWAFEYTASVLAAAAETKREHHKSRSAWWESKQAEVISEVKEKGLEVSESLAMEYSTMSALANNVRVAQLVVKNDYQAKLNECHLKIREHAKLAKEYDGWLQMLEANPQHRVKLDIDDYLFFFGK